MAQRYTNIQVYGSTIDIMRHVISRSIKAQSEWQ